MKTTICILSLGLALCVVSVFYQNHRVVRQEAAISLLQEHYDAALGENRILKIALQKKSATSGALSSAHAIAARYQAHPPAAVAVAGGRH